MNTQQKEKDKAYSASQNYFERLGLISYFSDSEKHSIVSRACSRLMSVHQGFDNFYNEPPFAERLYNITKESGVPDSAKDEYVKVVTTCYVGNVYGYSRGLLSIILK